MSLGGCLGTTRFRDGALPEWWAGIMPMPGSTSLILRVSSFRAFPAPGRVCLAPALPACAAVRLPVALPGAALPERDFALPAFSPAFTLASAFSGDNLVALSCLCEAGCFARRPAGCVAFVPRGASTAFFAFAWDAAEPRRFAGSSSFFLTLRDFAVPALSDPDDGFRVCRAASLPFALEPAFPAFPSCCVLDAAWSDLRAETGPSPEARARFGASCAFRETGFRFAGRAVKSSSGISSISRVPVLTLSAIGVNAPLSCSFYGYSARVRGPDVTIIMEIIVFRKHILLELSGTIRNKL